MSGANTPSSVAAAGFESLSNVASQPTATSAKMACIGAPISSAKGVRASAGQREATSPVMPSTARRATRPIATASTSVIASPSHCHAWISRKRCAKSGAGIHVTSAPMP